MSALLPDKTIPNLNYFRILQMVWKRPGISRVELAGDLGLTKSTVTKIITALLAQGLLRETHATRSGNETAGRPRMVLELNPDFGAVIGLELRTDSWQGVVLNLRGELIATSGGQFRHDPEPVRAERLASHIALFLAALRDEAQARGLPVLGAGVALPGVVNPVDGILLRSNPLGVAGELPLGDDLTELLDFPVLLENDANCGCWGELAFNAAEVPQDFLFVLCESRLHRGFAAAGNLPVAAAGFGLVAGGELMWGPSWSVGEFSSVLKRTKVETMHQFALPNGLMPVAFEPGEVRDRLIDELARNIAMLVNFLNLRLVVISWPGDPAPVLDALQRAIAENSLYEHPVECQLRTPAGGAQAVARGAGGFVLENLFRPQALDTRGPRWK
jgi:predicted NBD/HSP70 family sugar kinase